MAASMLLSIYEALNRSNALQDSMQGWIIYFNGCIMIFQSFSLPTDKYSEEAETLLDWISYYSVFCKLCVVHWFQQQNAKQGIADHDTILSWALPQSRSSLIKSSLGCSLSLLRLLNRCIQLAGYRNEDQALSLDEGNSLDVLQNRIETCQQVVCVTTNQTIGTGPGTRKHIAAVARLFQLSVLIYLDRVVRGLPGSSLLSQQSAREGFGILRDLQMCERPFPMLMLSLQAQDDDERRLLLSVIENTTCRRDLGDLSLTESLVRAIWAQQDLHGGSEVDGLLILNGAFGAYEKPPCLSFQSFSSADSNMQLGISIR